MHTNQTYNSLVIENPEFLNLPEVVKQHATQKDWENVVWNAFGLPAFQSNFCLTGTQLYFEAGPDGIVTLKKSDFSGDCLVSCVITPDNCENVFVLTIELTFCQGLLCASKIAEFQMKPRAEYDSGFKEFVNRQEKVAKICRSKLFRYLYVPYYMVVKWVTISIVFVVEFFLRCFVWCAEKITPIKF